MMVNSDSIENLTEETNNDPLTNIESLNNDSDQSAVEAPPPTEETAIETAPSDQSDNQAEPISDAAPDVEGETQSIMTEPDSEKPEEVSPEKLEKMIDEGMADETASADLLEKIEETNPVAEEVKQDNEKIKETEKIDNLAPIFAELKEIQNANGVIEVLVHERIRGGLRVYYKDFPMFLPASHFSLKRSPSEESLVDSIGAKLRVNIHELQEEDKGRRTAIVTRKNLLENDFWDIIKPGDIVEGVVSSVADFGVFLDMGGVEGLIHVSRLSKSRVDNPREFAKRGQYMQAVVVDVNKDKKRIALSTKELEESPWKGLDENLPPGTIVKGIIRRITDFGAYIELKPGVDGLLRSNELSWTRRIKHPEEILKVGDEIDVAVLNVNEEKQTATLSLRSVQPNPWNDLAAKYTVGSTWKGKAVQVMQQGAVVSLNDEVDGFMPRSKMKINLKGKKAPFNVGDEIDVIISDIVPGDESIILALPDSEDSDNYDPSSYSEREYQPREGQSREYQPRESQPRENQTREFQPRENKPREFQPRDNKPREIQPRDNKPREIQSRENKPREFQQRDNQSRDNQQRDNRSRDNHPRDNRRRDNKKDRDDNQSYQDSPSSEGAISFGDLLSDKAKKSLLGKNN